MLIPYSNLKNLFLNKLRLVFLTVFIVFGHSETSQAILLASAHEKPGSGYYRLVLNNLYRWYSEKYFPFEKNLSREERQLVQRVIEDIDEKSQYLDPHTSLPRFRISIELENETLNFGSLWISFGSRDARLQKNIAEVLRFLKLPLEKKEAAEISGIEWAFDKKEVSLFFSQKDKLIQKKYKKRILSETVTWTKLEHVKEEGGEVFAAGISEVWEVKSAKAIKKYVGTSMFPSKEFNEVIKTPMVSLAKEFGLKPQYILFEDKAHFRIYYQ